MRSLTVSRVEFDNYLFPGFASQGAQNEDDLEVRLRVLRKLKTVSTPMPGPETTNQGQRTFTNRTLDDGFATLNFEEDEYQALRSALVNSLPMWSLLAQEEVSEILSRLDEVPDEEE